MGAYTPDAQVWYPDTGDTAELNVLLGTMASSIEDGLGVRMAHQETILGFLGHLPITTYPALSSTESAALNFQVIAGSGSYNDGFSVTAGVVTIPVTGLYFISSSDTCSAQNGEFNTYVSVNTTKMWRGYSKSSTSAFGYNTGSVVVKLNVGDTVKVTAAVFGSAGNVSIINGQYYENALSVALLKAF